VARYGLNDYCGLLVNSSRSIIYASGGEDFAQRAAEEAAKLAWRRTVDFFKEKLK